MVQENIEEIQKKAEKFETQYNKIKQEFKDYIETSKKNEEKKRLDIRSDISKRLLVVADSLNRIAGTGNAGSCELMKGHTENIIKNINAVYSQMLSASGLTAIEPLAGDKFDEQKHIAIGLEFGVKYPEDTVFKVVRKGYLMENNVVRPAEVIISKNPNLQRIAKSGLWSRLLRIIKPVGVNLAYSVLKNESQRTDYLWLSENIDIFNALGQISSEEEEEEIVPLKNQKKRNRKKKQGVRKKSPSQVTFEDIERMMKKIFQMGEIRQNR